MHNDIMLEESENALISKLFMASKNIGIGFFSLKKPGFRFLTATETALATTIL